MELKAAFPRPDWLKMIESILTEPGRLGDYYHAFHNYSLGNQALAVEQLLMRDIEVSPISSFQSWKLKGRRVKKGEKAIGLWMPFTPRAKPGEVKGSDRKVDPSQLTPTVDGEKRGPSRMAFMMKNNWFAFSQTEVDPHAETPAVEPMKAEMSWDAQAAMQKLGITEVPFAMVGGNTQGWALPTAKQIALNPMAQLPHKTRFHELAHCLLHGDETVEMVDGSDLKKSIKEAEAESVAFLCCSALNLPGLAEARGYVQSWLGHSTTDREAYKKSAGRIFSTADKILKAGLNVNAEVAHG
ncbi:hypothetical protein [Acidovorax sp. sic0104]|uniref:hypothetical protein n=1 Tax=Acidovorax sp. sic0104 TaxID=2854784 RepID=UPI001C48C07B|nr:hypothetical protein [Acidovorax sp. sic0104]MBV7542153.1 hypothetical protein [Acidovorax sp. sic0104]